MIFANFVFSFLEKSPFLFFRLYGGCLFKAASNEYQAFAIGFLLTAI